MTHEDIKGRVWYFKATVPFISIPEHIIMKELSPFDAGVFLACYRKLDWGYFVMNAKLLKLIHFPTIGTRQLGQSLGRLEARGWIKKANGGKAEKARKIVCWYYVNESTSKNKYDIVQELEKAPVYIIKKARENIEQMDTRTLADEKLEKELGQGDARSNVLKFSNKISKIGRPLSKIKTTVSKPG